MSIGMMWGKVYRGLCMVELKLFHKFLIFIAVIVSLLRLSRNNEPKIKKAIVSKPVPVNAKQPNGFTNQQSMQHLIQTQTQQHAQLHKLAVCKYRITKSIPDARISETISDAPDRLLF
jgi:hypothetical protein